MLNYQGDPHVHTYSSLGKPNSDSNSEDEPAMSWNVHGKQSEGTHWKYEDFPH